jgi:hypothetical protein
MSIFHQVDLGLTENYYEINSLKSQLNPICHFLALLGAHPILHVSMIRVKFNKTGNAGIT